MAAMMIVSFLVWWFAWSGSLAYPYLLSRSNKSNLPPDIQRHWNDSVLRPLCLLHLINIPIATPPASPTVYDQHGGSWLAHHPPAVLYYFLFTRRFLGGEIGVCRSLHGSTDSTAAVSSASARCSRRGCLPPSPSDMPSASFHHDWTPHRCPCCSSSSCWPSLSWRSI